MTKHEQLVWAAGFFDGEGCVNLSKPVTRQKRKDGSIACYPGYQLQVVVCQRSRIPMDMLVEVFGGHLSKLKTHGWTYWWYRIHGKRAVAVLKKLLPYLVLKKANAELGIAFQSLVEASQPARYERRDPKAVAMLEGFYKASKSMNKRNKPMDYTVQKSTKKGEGLGSVQ